jgi:molecular chaperone GrpE
MKPERNESFFPEEPAEPDDIEILEVVGMDEAEVPGAASEDEVVVAFDDLPVAAPAAPDRTAEVEEARERLLRLRADFDNLKKRIEREREEYSRQATASLVARLLPVLDNLERALEAARCGRGNGDALQNGVALIQRQLLDELRREGLRAVESVGQSFDPAVHEAVATDGASQLPINTVVEELQRGYYFDDRLLRPALVRVAVGEGLREARRSEGEES